MQKAKPVFDSDSPSNNPPNCFPRAVVPIRELSEVLVGIIDSMPELTFPDCQSPLFFYNSFLSPVSPLKTPLNESNTVHFVRKKRPKMPEVLTYSSNT